MYNFLLYIIITSNFSLQNENICDLIFYWTIESNVAWVEHGMQSLDRIFDRRWNGEWSCSDLCIKTSPTSQSHDHNSRKKKTWHFSWWSTTVISIAAYIPTHKVIGFIPIPFFPPESAYDWIWHSFKSSNSKVIFSWYLNFSWVWAHD